jgi:hypothetical protein
MEFYIINLTMTQYRGDDVSLWTDLGGEILSRTLTKEYLLNIANLFSICDTMDGKFWNGLVRKIEEAGLRDYKDCIILSHALGKVKYTADDPVWSSILTIVENEKVNVKDLPSTFVLSASNEIKSRVNRDSPFFTNVREYYINNLSVVNPDHAYIFLKEFVKFDTQKNSDLLELVKLTLPIVKGATKYALFEYYKVILEWCLQYSGFRNELEKHKVSFESLNVPSAAFVSQYEEYTRRVSNLTDLNEVESVHEKFWVDHANSLGFTPAFASTYSTQGIFNYESLMELKH